MHNWSELAASVESFKACAYSWSGEATLALQEPPYIVLECIDRAFLTALAGVISAQLTDDEKKARIRFILEVRGNLIANSSLDYTLNPESPVNLACVAIAAFIAMKNEAVCKILMPSLKRVIGASAEPENLHEGTTDVEGHFLPSEYLVSADGEALISLPDVLECSANDTNVFFPVVQSDLRRVLNSKFPLTNKDRDQIHSINPAYIDLLQNIHREKQLKKPSIGWAIEELYSALLQSSVANTGSEMAVNILEFREPVIAFYHLWNLIPPDRKIKINKYQYGSRSLEDFLLCLFVNIHDVEPTIVITEKEYKLYGETQLFPCAHQIGNALNSLLLQNPDLFSMPLPGKEKEFEETLLPTQKALFKLKDDAIKALKLRKPLSGMTDSWVARCTKIVAVLLQSIESNKFSLQENCNNINSEIHSLSDFFKILSIIPKDEWKSLIGKNKEIFLNEARSKIYLLALNTISPAHWFYFFEGIPGTHFQLGFEERDWLGRVLNGLPKYQWHLFYDAASSLISDSLKTPVELVNFIAEIPVDRWVDVYETFKEKIDLVVSDARKMSEVFILISPAYWSDLRDTFEPIFDLIVENPITLVQFLTGMNFPQRNNFIENIAGFNEKTELTVSLVAALLNTIEPAQWDKLVVRQLGKTRFLAFFSNSTHLAFLFNQLPVSLWGHIYKILNIPRAPHFCALLLSNISKIGFGQLPFILKTQLTFNLEQSHFLLAVFSEMELSVRLYLLKWVVLNFRNININATDAIALFKLFKKEDRKCVFELLISKMSGCFNAPDRTNNFLNLFLRDDFKKIAPMIIQVIVNIKGFNPKKIDDFQEILKNLPGKMCNFLDVPMHLALLFFAIPEDNWLQLERVIRKNLQLNLSSKNFIEGFLSFFNLNEKIKILNIMRSSFKEISPDFMVRILRLFPVENWSSIVSVCLCSNMRKIFFMSVNELGEFINQFNAKLLKIIYPLFKMQILKILDTCKKRNQLKELLSAAKWSVLISLLPSPLSFPKAPLTPRIATSKNPVSFFTCIASPREIVPVSHLKRQPWR